MKPDYQQLVNEINLAIEKGDLDFVAAHVSDDIRWEISGQDKPITGKADFMQCYIDTPFKDGSVKIKVTNVLIDGEKAAAEGTMEAETLDGKAFQMRFCDIYYFEGDKIKQMSSYLDTEVPIVKN
jgi:ketosteroid isomerase-like protein